MNKNLYWSVFKNLEKELVELSTQIHIDDNQLNVYSVKITELIIRTVVEIESISKELYYILGGNKADDNNLFFDTDCIQHLEDNWKLSKKKIFVSAFNFYLINENNKVLTPLKKANRRGSSSSEWQKAYQAIKHNRVKNLKKGNLKNLLSGLGALYLLNIYFKDIIFESINDRSGTNLDLSMGSSIFSIKSHRVNGIHPVLKYNKLEDFDECTYLIKATDITLEVFQMSMNNFNSEFQQKISKNIDTNKDNTDVTRQKIIDASLNQVSKDILIKYKMSEEDIKYEAVLNKQQF